MVSQPLAGWKRYRWGRGSLSVVEIQYLAREVLRSLLKCENKEQKDVFDIHLCSCVPSTFEPVANGPEFKHTLFSIYNKTVVGSYTDIHQFESDLKAFFQEAQTLDPRARQFQENFDIAREEAVIKVFGDPDDPEFENAADEKKPVEETESTKDYKDIYLEIYRNLIGAKDANGKLLCHMFMRLPSRKIHPDYYEFIKKPIDMSTIHSKILSGHYSSPQKFEHDYVLMFRNAKRYNTENSDVYNNAVKLNELFKKLKEDLLDPEMKKEKVRQNTVDFSAVQRLYTKRKEEYDMGMNGRGQRKRSSISLEGKAQVKKFQSKSIDHASEGHVSVSTGTDSTFGGKITKEKKKVYKIPASSRDEDEIIEKKIRNESDLARSRGRLALFGIRHFHAAASETINEEFEELPDKKEYPDYYDVISNPMSLSIIENKVERGRPGYKDFPEVLEDLKLVLSNAMYFNKPSSKISKEAQQLKNFLDYISKVFYFEDLCYYLYDEICKLKDDEGYILVQVFAKLPPPKALPVYYTIIHEPVDLDCVSKSLVNFAYHDVLTFCHRRKLAQITEVTSQTFDSHPPKSLFDAFLSDLFLMCDNAMLFNEKKSSIWNSASQLKTFLLSESKKVLEPTNFFEKLDTTITLSTLPSCVDSVGDSTTVGSTKRSAAGISGSNKKTKLHSDDAIPPVEPVYLNSCFLDITKSLIGYTLDDENISEAFVLLPDKEEYPEYYDFIDNPIDLQTIKDRVDTTRPREDDQKNFYYTSVSAFEKDVRLLWKNAQSFNEEGSEIYVNSKILQKYTKTLISDLKKKLTETLIEPKTVTKTNSKNSKPPNKNSENENRNKRNKESSVDGATNDAFSCTFVVDPSLAESTMVTLPKTATKPVISVTLPTCLPPSTTSVTLTDRSSNATVPSTPYVDRPSGVSVTPAPVLSTPLGFTPTPINPSMSAPVAVDVTNDADLKRAVADRIVIRRIFQTMSTNLLDRILNFYYGDTKAAGPFMKLPDKTLYPDYYDKISKPIDLTQVKERVHDERYLNLENFSADLNDIWLNAKHCNEPSSLTYKCAEALEIMVKGQLEIMTKDIHEHKLSLKRARRSRKTLVVFANEEKELNKLMLKVYSDITTYQPDGIFLFLPFAEVPSKEMFPQYYSIIKTPIDLKTIYAKLQNGLKDVDEFIADLNQVWDNAKIYYQPGSDFHNMALTLESYSKELIRVLLDEANKTTVYASGRKHTLLYYNQYPRISALNYILCRVLNPDPMFVDAQGQKTFLIEPFMRLQAIPDTMRIDMQTILTRTKNNVYRKIEDYVTDVLYMFSYIRILCRKSTNGTEIATWTSNANRLLENFLLECKHLNAPIPVNYTGQTIDLNIADWLPRFPFSPTEKENNNSVSHLSASVALPQPPTSATSTMISTFTLPNVTPVSQTPVTSSEDKKLSLPIKDTKELPKDTDVVETKFLLENEDAKQGLMRLICDMICDKRNKDHEKIILPFMMLPSGEDLPDYFTTVKDPIDFSTIINNVDTDLYKENFLKFGRDVCLMFSNARVYNKEDCEIYKDSLILQEQFLRLFIMLWATYELDKENHIESFLNQQVQEIKQCFREIESAYAEEIAEEDMMPPTNSAGADGVKEPLASSNHTFVDSVEFQGQTYRVGEHVMLQSNEESQPLIVLIEKLWYRKDNKKRGNSKENYPFLHGTWYYWPKQTFHVSGRKFYKNELFRTATHHTNSFSKVLGHCYVLLLKDYVRYTVREDKAHKDSGRQRSVKDISFVVDQRYQEKTKGFSKIKTWNVPDQSALFQARIETFDTKREFLADDPEISTFYNKKKFDLYKALNLPASSGTLKKKGKNVYYEYYSYDKMIYQIGDTVYMNSPDTENEYYVMLIDQIYEDSTGLPFISGTWFLKPEETHHSASKQFYKTEYILSTDKDSNPMSAIVSKCSILPYNLYISCRKYGIPEDDVFLYESLYQKRTKQILKLKLPNENEFRLKHGLLRLPSPLESVERVPSPLTKSTPTTVKKKDQKANQGQKATRSVEKSESPQPPTPSVKTSSDDMRIKLRDPILKYPIKLSSSVNLYRCRWKDCGLTLETFESFVEHVMIKHVPKVGDKERKSFYCQWLLCKSPQESLSDKTFYDHLIENHVMTGKDKWPGALAACPQDVVEEYRKKNGNVTAVPPKKVQPPPSTISQQQQQQPSKTQYHVPTASGTRYISTEGTNKIAANNKSITKTNVSSQPRPPHQNHRQNNNNNKNNITSSLASSQPPSATTSLSSASVGGPSASQVLARTNSSSANYYKNSYSVHPQFQPQPPPRTQQLQPQQKSSGRNYMETTPEILVYSDKYLLFLEKKKDSADDGAMDLDPRSPSPSSSPYITSPPSLDFTKISGKSNSSNILAALQQLTTEILTDI